MVKFAHIADVHLGGWKQQPMQELNFQSFKKTIDICIQEKLDFVLIAGDLFDSAYPPIEILKETFAQFKRLKESEIPCFIIAGSHDFSISGKTFLDVLEKAGFCKNVTNFEIIEHENKIRLNPTLYKNVALYGYPGKKSSMEIPELRKLKLNDTPGLFKIFLLHTTIDKAKGSLPIDSIEIDLLPKADYYALGHLHIDFKYKNFIYPGPVFPNNFQELEDLKYGRFCIVNTDEVNSLRKIELKIKEVLPLKFKIKNSLIATGQILSELEKYNIKDKIILLRISGELENGKQSDINFQQIEKYAKEKGAYFILKNTHDLKIKQETIEINLDKKDSADAEQETIKIYSEQNPSDFNLFISQLINILSVEKQEDEKTEIFNTR